MSAVPSVYEGGLASVKEAGLATTQGVVLCKGDAARKVVAPVVF